MNRKHKAILLALLAVILFSFFIKYPVTNHLRGADSPDFYYMANLVSMDGKAVWNMHWLSLFGLYPFCEPMGQVYFMSGVSQLAGVPMESAILIMNFGTLLVSVLSFFLVGRKIFQNNIVGLLVPLLFVQMGDTLFTSTPRIFVGFFLSFMLLLLLNSYETIISGKLNKKILVLFLVTLVTILATHRLTYLFIPVILSYPFVEKFFPKVQSFVSKRSIKFSTIHGKIIPFIKAISLPLLLLGMLFFTLTSFQMFFGAAPVREFLTDTTILSGESIHIKIINFTYYLGKQIGPSAAFSMVGLLLLGFKKNNSKEIFIVVGMLILIPFSIRKAYIFFPWATLLIPIAGFGAYRIGNFLLKKERLKIIKIGCIALLLLSPIIIRQNVTIVEPTDQKSDWKESYISDQQWEAGIVAKYALNINETGYTPGGRSNAFASISQRNFLRLNGREMFWANESIKDKINITFEKDSITNISLQEFMEEKGNFYKTQNDPLFPSRDNYYRKLHFFYLGKRYKQKAYYKIIEYYNLKSIVRYKKRPINTLPSYGRTLIDNVQTESYKTFENSDYSYYTVPL